MTPKDDAPPSSHFEPLSRARCEELLSGQRAGRVAWNAYDGPELLPVSYGMDNGQIVFRTSPYGVLSQLAQHRCKVAFEIDHIDSELGTGWSVVARGTAAGVHLSYDLARLWGMEGMVPWATGSRNLFIAITPQTITGRLVKAPFAD